VETDAAAKAATSANVSEETLCMAGSTLELDGGEFVRRKRGIGRLRNIHSEAGTHSEVRRASRASAKENTMLYIP
jgi:hypothetical protein